MSFRGWRPFLVDYAADDALPEKEKQALSRFFGPADNA
jgi:hypothetical protein